MVWYSCLQKNDPSPINLCAFDVYRCLVLMSKTNPMCKVCGAKLNNENWYSSYQKTNHYLCKKCHNKQQQQWRKANPKKTKAQQTRGNRQQGERPYNENKECPSFLGVHVAERVLSHIFKNVKRMSMNNPGFDFICNRGKKIDVKSACLFKNSRWHFRIRRNTIADYFLLLAFDNREDLNPLHVWLIPGSKLNHLMTTSISPSSIHKWDKYRLDVSKVIECCNVIRTSHKT